jgi:purine nucleoside phosphorylase
MLSERIFSSNTVGDLKETEGKLKIFSQIFNFTFETAYAKKESIQLFVKCVSSVL